MPKITENKLNGYIELKVELVGQKWKDLLKTTKEKLISNVELKGFRKGHVPKNIAKNYIKDEVVREKALDLLIEEKNSELMKLLDKHKIISRPKVILEKISDDLVEFSIKATLIPEIKLGDLKSLKTKFEFSEPTKDEIKKEMEQLESFFTKKVSSNESLKNGETAQISFNGKIDGKEFEGGKSDNYELKIGSKTFIDNFEDQMIGMKKGETKIIKVKFPKTYHVVELANKPVEFEVVLKDIFKLENLEGDELKSKLQVFGHETKDDLIKMMTKMLSSQKLENSKNDFFRNIKNEILAKPDFKLDLSKEMIFDEVENEIKIFEEEISKQGMKLDAYLKMINKSIDEFKKNEIFQRAKDKITSSLIFTKLIEELKIELEDKDFEEEYKNISESQNMKIDDVKKEISKDSISSALLFNKLIDKLKTLK